MKSTDTARPKIRIHHGNALNTPITVGVPFPADVSMVGLVMTVGYERTGEEDFLVAGRLILETYLDSSAPGSDGTGGQIKPCAMAYRGLHRLLGVLEREGQLQQYEYPAHRDHFSDERTIGAM